MAVCLTAEFAVRPEARERCEEAARQFVAAIGANEPGTRLYASFQAEDDPNRFLHVMVFEDDAARAFHQGTDWVKRFTDVIYPEAVDGVRFTGYRMVALT